jgi:hypothetical protein
MVDCGQSSNAGTEQSLLIQIERREKIFAALDLVLRLPGPESVGE